MFRHIRSCQILLTVVSFTLSAHAFSNTSTSSLEQRLEALEREIEIIRQEIARSNQQPPDVSGSMQATTPSQIESRTTKAEPAPVASPRVAGNRVFFRGGYAKLSEDRGRGAFTDMIDVPGALGLPSIVNDDDDGWYFGAGFDFLLSRDTLGLLPGVWTLAELSVEFRNLGGRDAHLIGPVAECLLLNEISGNGAPGALNCTNIKGQQNMTMLTVSASPKLKFMEGSKLRPWIIPAGFDVHVISPPSDSTNYLDVGVQFAAGVDYEIMSGVTLGADFRYHLAADFTDPDYDAAAVTAAANAGLLPTGLTLDTDQGNDVWTLGLSLGITF